MTYEAPKDLLKEKVILVTGAGNGIGAVAARSCAAHGATVILLGRTTEKLEAVYDEIVAAGHPEPGIVPMDLSQITQPDV
ncbi:MAG: SDR family NAD(P)-dependent oxidoreductase, partial [bacterium]